MSCPVLRSCLGSKRGGDRIDLLHHEFPLQRQLSNVFAVEFRQLPFSWMIQDKERVPLSYRPRLSRDNLRFHTTHDTHSAWTPHYRSATNSLRQIDIFTSKECNSTSSLSGTHHPDIIHTLNEVRADDHCPRVMTSRNSGPRSPIKKKLIFPTFCLNILSDR
jgi:hypothetical protein